MSKISALMKKLASKEGVNDTLLPGIRIFKASQYQSRQPLCYEQGIIIVGQGSKRVFLDGNVYEYNPDNYLVLSVALPALCETEANEDNPLLAMVVSFDIEMLNRIIGQMDHHLDHSLVLRKGDPQGLFVAKMTDDIEDTVLRMLRTLQSPLETKVIGSGMIHELIFRIMCGENAASLYALAINNTNISRIDKALKLIHGNYRDAMEVEKLAALVNMSPSSFHRAFKEVTASSPIQYLKKIRLDKARILLTERGLRVNEAATEVGYQSATQFSREFKRYFGSSPIRFVAAHSAR